MIGGRKVGALVRSFVAIDLPEDLRVACAGIAGRLRAGPDGDGVRWVRPESYHLTLRFLGNVGAEVLPELGKRLGEALGSAAPFALRLGAVRPFPSLRRPRVVVAEVGPEATLVALAGRVEAAVVEAGLPPERRAFRPHLTLGRVRARRIPPLEGATLAATPEAAVREVVLYRSDLGTDGAVHTALERFALRAPDADASSP